MDDTKRGSEAVLRYKWKLEASEGYAYRFVVERKEARVGVVAEPPEIQTDDKPISVSVSGQHVALTEEEVIELIGTLYDALRIVRKRR